MQFGVKERVMLVDKTKEIAELKKQLQEQKNGYEELVKVNDNKEIEKQEAIKKLKNIEEIIRSIQFRQGMTSKAIRYTRRDLEKLETAQKKLERKNKINDMLSTFPTFLEMVEDKLKVLETKQKLGNKTPLDFEYNSLRQIAKIAELESLEYVRTNGMTDAYKVYGNIKKQYDDEVQYDVELSLTSSSFTKEYGDYAFYAERLISNNDIHEFLGRQ